MVEDAAAGSAAAQPVALRPAVAATLALRVVDRPVRLLAIGSTVPDIAACSAAVEFLPLIPATRTLP